MDNSINHLGLSCLSKFLDDNIYKELHEIIQNSEFEEIYQERPDHYKHVFKSSSKKLNTNQDSYKARFDLANNESSIELIKEKIFPYFVSALKSFNRDLKYFMIPSLVRLKKDSFYRMHVDDYAGQAGYTYFFNDGWKWDYGGILTYVESDGSNCFPIFPENNMILLRDENIKAFHYVTQQMEYANKPQYLLLGWASIDEIKDSKIRNYVKI